MMDPDRHASIHMNRVQVSYSKRKSCVLKKANELNVLCDVDVALVSFSPSGRVSYFPRDRFSDVLTRYLNMPADSKNYAIKKPTYFLKQLDHIKGGDGVKANFVKNQAKQNDQQVTLLTEELKTLEAELRIFEPGITKILFSDEIQWHKSLLVEHLRNIRKRKETLLINSHLIQQSNVRRRNQRVGRKNSFGMNLGQGNNGILHQYNNSGFVNPYKNPSRLNRNLYIQNTDNTNPMHNTCISYAPNLSSRYISGTSSTNMTSQVPSMYHPIQKMMDGNTRNRPNKQLRNIGSSFLSDMNRVDHHSSMLNIKEINNNAITINQNFATTEVVDPTRVSTTMTYNELQVDLIQVAANNNENEKNNNLNEVNLNEKDIHKSCGFETNQSVLDWANNQLNMSELEDVNDTPISNDQNSATAEPLNLPRLSLPVTCVDQNIKGKGKVDDLGDADATEFKIRDDEYARSQDYAFFGFEADHLSVSALIQGDPNWEDYESLMLDLESFNNPINTRTDNDQDIATTKPLEALRVSSSLTTDLNDLQMESIKTLHNTNGDNSSKQEIQNGEGDIYQEHIPFDFEKKQDSSIGLIQDMIKDTNLRAQESQANVTSDEGFINQENWLDLIDIEDL